jgi:hypothetical protein
VLIAVWPCRLGGPVNGEWSVLVAQQSNNTKKRAIISLERQKEIYLCEIKPFCMQGLKRFLEKTCLRFMLLEHFFNFILT